MQHLKKTTENKKITFMQNTQRQLTEIDRRLLRGFKTTSSLSASLSKPPKTKTMSPFLLLSGGEKVKKYIEDAEIEKKTKILKRNEVDMNIENEVKTLGTVKVGEPCLRTEEMIRKQKESRRRRHIDFLKDFEKVVETMEKGGEENEKKVTIEIEAFFRISDKEISSYLENLTDGELLSREDEFLGELENFATNHKNKRNEKLFNYYAVIKAIEGDRMAAVNQISKKLFNDLFETAFILEDEINVLIDERKKKLEENFNAFVEKNREKMETINAMRNENFKKFEEIVAEKDHRWRVLKHDQAVLQFRTDIQNLTFVNPPERVQLYEGLKVKILKYFELKKNRLQILLQRKDHKILKTEILDKFNEEFHGLVDRINLKYDRIFDKLLKHHEATQEQAKIKISQLSSRLRFLSAIDTIQDVLIELDKLIKKLDEEGKNLMSKAIKFVEENEVRVNDVILNISVFVSKIAAKMEEQRRETRNFDKNYELEKAKIADSNDETLDHLNQTFANMKVALQQSVHHPQLQENLEKCFAKLDEIEQEYRQFHSQNLDLAKCHPASISSLFQKFQKDFASFFSLLDSSHLDQLNARNLEKAKKKAQILYEEEEAQKLKEEERQMEELKKKGGKVPPKPKKDPKKAALEQEARLKELMEKVGLEEVKKFETKLGGVFIESINMKELTRKFFHPHDDQPNEGENQEIPEEQIVDLLPESPLDPEGRNILDKNIVFSVSFVQSLLASFRESMFEFLFDFHNENLNNASNTDKEFIEESIEILDERLKLHYPLKGRLETEDFATRSSQITEHKKRYERHTRTTLEKANDQTDHFNYLLESALNEAKEYESDQNKLRESLGSVMSLPKLQGMQNTVRENVFKFEEKIREFEKQLKNLSENEINNLLNANSRLISGSKLISETGTFSADEIHWYKVMLEEIDKQLLSQQEIKKAKTKDIIEFMSKKKQEALETFEKNYATAIEELACREGTGKKYGRPRRLYQERLRMEMTKCEKAQEAIARNIETLRKLYENYKLEINKPESETLTLEKNKTLSIRIRRVMMKIRTCMGRYQSHILALKPDNKSSEMPRVTYNEYKFDITVENDQIEKDKQLKEEELEELGPLFYQKDSRSFNEYILEIEKLVKEEAQKIYIGPAAKFLAGADKIPDYLRNYLENNRKNVEDFRIGCIRQLRNSVDEFSKLTPMISEMILISIKCRYEIWLVKEEAFLESLFYQEKKKNEETKQHLDFKLRPNLSNPSCKDELDSVCKAEVDRFSNMKAELSKFMQKRLDSEFTINNEFFKVFLNNTEFLLVLYDNMFLFEDFVKLPGDEDIVKKHDNLKTLLKRKQKGALIDTSSERSLTKIWPGFLIDSFRIDERKIEYAVSNPAVEKKDAKNVKKDEPEQVIKDTKEIKTFKTFRQKSVISFRNKLFAELKNRFDEEISKLKADVEKIQYEEDKYQFFWEQKVDSLTNK